MIGAVTAGKLVKYMQYLAQKALADCACVDFYPRFTIGDYELKTSWLLI